MKRYKFGFTAGALLEHEIEVVMNSINDFKDFLNEKENIDWSIIPVNSEKSKKRYSNEIHNRLRSLDVVVLDSYLSLSSMEKKI